MQDNKSHYANTINILQNYFQVYTDTALMGHRIDDITWRYIHKSVEKFKPAIYNI